MVRHPRFELGPSAWKADILAIILMPLFREIVYYTIFVLILRELKALLNFHQHFYSIGLKLIMIFDFQHLKTANINYFSHGIRVIKVSLILISLGIIGIIHGMLPFVFVETVSNRVKKIADEMSHF